MSVLNKINDIYKGIKQVVKDVVNLFQGCGYINKGIEFDSNILDNAKSLTNELSNRWVDESECENINKYINKSKCLIGDIGSQALDGYIYYQGYKNSLQKMMNQGNANMLSYDFTYVKIDGRIWIFGKQVNWTKI